MHISSSLEKLLLSLTHLTLFTLWRRTFFMVMFCDITYFENRENTSSLCSFMITLFPLIEVWMYCSACRSWKCRHGSTASPCPTVCPLVWALTPPCSISRFSRAASLCLRAQEELPPRTSSVSERQPLDNHCQPPSCPRPPRTLLQESPSAAPWTWAAWALLSSMTPPQPFTLTWAWETFWWTTGAPCLLREWLIHCFLLCHLVPLKLAVAEAALKWMRTCDDLCVAVRDFLLGWECQQVRSICRIILQKQT